MQNSQQIFKLHSEYKPTGDQPQAIEKLVKGFKEGNQFETLLGVTGSGKTFTMANVIQALNKPTLIISHNKTLAGQLYGEMKEFFPENAVEYFVSYYDYYQPEAYVPQSDTYIAKDSAVNDENDNPVEYYVDMAAFNDGDILRAQDSATTYQIGETIPLQGVYCINKGYAVFRKIQIIDQNAEYSIIKKQTQYGISQYDYIVENASTVSEEDIVH